MRPSDWTWIAPTRCPPPIATSVVTPGAVSARRVRATSSAYSVQPSAATSAISPSRWACVNGSIEISVMRHRRLSSCFNLGIARQPLKKSRHPAGAEVEEPCPLGLDPDQGHLVVDRPDAALELRHMLRVQHLPRGCDVLVRNAVDDVHGCDSTHQELLRVRGRVADID